MDSEDYSDHLHKGARASTHQNARELRSNETEAEKKIWTLIRNRQLKGKKFRRQHAFSEYVLDFYCHECKLAVELDGGIHQRKENKEYDSTRTQVLNMYGINVLRFWNDEVMNDTTKVLEKIANHLS